MTDSERDALIAEGWTPPPTDLERAVDAFWTAYNNTPHFAGVKPENRTLAGLRAAMPFMVDL